MVGIDEILFIFGGDHIKNDRVARIKEVVFK